MTKGCGLKVILGVANFLNSNITSIRIKKKLQLFASFFYKESLLNLPLCPTFLSLSVVDMDTSIQMVRNVNTPTRREFNVIPTRGTKRARKMISVDMWIIKRIKPSCRMVWKLTWAEGTNQNVQEVVDLQPISTETERLFNISHTRF